MCDCVFVSYWSLQTFDGETEIIAQGDFAATTEMKAKPVAACGYPTTCQQCVVLALHSPRKVDCGRREVGSNRLWEQLCVRAGWCMGECRGRLAAFQRRSKRANGCLRCRSRLGRVVRALLL